MNQVIGDVLPLALAVALCPIPIIAVVVMLLTPKATSTGPGYLLGWIAGIVLAVVAFVALARLLGLSSTDDESSSTSWIALALGAIMLFLAARQWASRPKPGQEAGMPKWAAAVDSFTAVKATGLGFALAALNPKSLTLCAAAGIVIGSSDLKTGQSAIVVAVFTLIGISTVALPVIASLLARERMRRPLQALHAWLVANNAVVMSLVLLMIGVVLIGRGIG